MTDTFRALCEQFADTVDLLCSHGESRANPGSRLILTAHVDALEELAADARQLTLLDRVAEGIANTGWDTDDYNCEACAAIREVAEWLRENPGPNSAWLAVARDLMDEANR